MDKINKLIDKAENTNELTKEDIVKILKSSGYEGELFKVQTGRRKNMRK